MKRYPYTLLTALAICIASIIPVPEVPLKQVPFYDKWVHFLMYGTLSLIAWVEGRRHSAPGAERSVAVVAIVVPVAFGGLMELAQAYLTTSRSGDWLDFAANATGVLLAALLVGLYHLVCRPKRKPIGPEQQT